MRQNKLIRIGVTGGMGAGKTTVADILEEAGLLVVDADMISRDVLELYPEVHDYIRTTYGTAFDTADGALDRRSFARMIFAKPDELARYEEVIMPFILEEIRERFAFIEEATTDEYAVLDAPLLFEVRDKDVYDLAVTVEMPEDLQVRRAMARDGLTEEEVRARIARQMPRAKREKLADYVIVNDGSLEELREKTLAVLDAIRNRS